MGPLTGLKVVEMAGIGPTPMCAMLLADLGATVLRIDRKTQSGLGRQRPLRYNLNMRNRKAIALDLKQEPAVALVMSLIESADVLIEGYRPGVMERLGLGPDACLEKNRRLIYGRMTGWGQTGPLSMAAGHDINYIAITGALNAIGRRGQPPTQPLNLVGDFGGGALYLAFGIMSAVFETRHSGQGQVVDAAIVDGVASLLTSLYGLDGAGMVSARGTNITDSGSYFYNTYRCSDGNWISIGPVEPKFFEELLNLLGIDQAVLPSQKDEGEWERGYAVLAEHFSRRTRDEWCELLEGTDACFAPVLSLTEAPHHKHLMARGTFLEIDGVLQPAPAPRFSRTAPSTPTPPSAPNPKDVEIALRDWLPMSRIVELRKEALFGGE